MVVGFLGSGQLVEERRVFGEVVLRGLWRRQW